MFCFYLSLAALHNNQFLLRRGSGENNLSVVLQDVVELLGGQIFQVSTVDDAGLGISEREDGRRCKNYTNNYMWLKDIKPWVRKHSARLTRHIRAEPGPEHNLGVLHFFYTGILTNSPWVDFVDRDVQACSDVLDGLVAFGDDAHTLRDGLSCDWMITCYHDNLEEGTLEPIS